MTAKLSFANLSERMTRGIQDSVHTHATLPPPDRKKIQRENKKKEREKTSAPQYTTVAVPLSGEDPFGEKVKQNVVQVQNAEDQQLSEPARQRTV